MHMAQQEVHARAADIAYAAATLLLEASHHMSEGGCKAVSTRHLLYLHEKYDRFDRPQLVFQPTVMQVRLRWALAAFTLCAAAAAAAASVARSAQWAATARTTPILIHGGVPRPTVHAPTSAVC